MCLQGLDQSGQEHLVVRSPSRVGKSDRPASWKTCSMSCGISPANSLAANSAWRESACASFFQSAAGSILTWMTISYGLGRDPCTAARTCPFSTWIDRTWPLRAYDRPRPSRAPMLKPSSTAIHRLAHQLVPNSPRFDCALIPPLACLGRDGGKYRPKSSSLQPMAAAPQGG